MQRLRWLKLFFRVSLHSLRKAQSAKGLSSTKSSVSKASIITDFKEITKMGLSISVVVSALAGYLLGADSISFTTLLLLAVGGYFMVGASNAYNQIIENFRNKFKCY